MDWRLTGSHVTVDAGCRQGLLTGAIVWAPTRSLSKWSVLPYDMVGGFREEGRWTSQNREPEGSCIELCDLAMAFIQCHFHHILGGSQGCMVRGEEKQILLLDGKWQSSRRACEARNIAVAILGEHSHSALTGCWVFFLCLLAKAKGIRISGHLSFLYLTTNHTSTHTDRWVLRESLTGRALLMNSSAQSHGLGGRRCKRGRKQHTLVKNHILEPNEKDWAPSLSTQLCGLGQVPLSCHSFLICKLRLIVAFTSLGCHNISSPTPGTWWVPNEY